MTGITGKILVVDDDVGFHRLVESILQPVGLSCVYVRTAEEALRLLQVEKPRAMLIDGLLPGMRGDDLAFKVRELYAQRELPIVFASSFFRDIKSHQRLVQQCKVDAVIHKPVSAEDLKRTFARIPGLSDIPGEAPVDLDLNTAVELLTDFLGIAEERMGNLRAAMTRLKDSGDDAALKTIKLESHRFRGTGASFGLPEVTRLGARIENLVDGLGNAALTRPALAELSGLVDALELKLARAGASVPSPGTRDAVRPMRIVLIDTHPGLVDSCSDAANRGLPIRLFADVATALAQLTEEPADVIFFAADTVGAGGADAARPLVDARICPVVAMSADARLTSRLRADEAGLRGYIHRLPDATSLFNVAPFFASTPRGVELVGFFDDAATLSGLADVLSGVGIALSPVTLPEALFDMLDRTEPAALVLSSQVGGQDAAPYIRALRADARHASLPILVHLKTGKAGSLVELLRAGADDVVTAQMSTDELVARFRAQIRRQSSQLRLGDVGGLPGFPDAVALKEALERAIVLARRGRTLAVLVFDADVSTLHRTQGRLAADAAGATLGARLQSSFRASDWVASLRGARFGVLLHDVSQADARRLLHLHSEKLSQPSALIEGLALPVRGGLASFPELDAAADAILQAALFNLESTLPAGME